MAQSLIKAAVSDGALGPRCLNNLHTLWSKNMRRERKGIKKANKISFMSRFEDRLPPTHPFQANALSKREQVIHLLTSTKESSLLHSSKYHLCGPSVWCEREKSGISSLYFFFYWLAVPITFALLLTTWTWTATSHHLKPRVIKLQFEW